HVSFGPRDGAVDHEPERPELFIGPVVAEDDWNSFYPQFSGGLQSQMSVDDVTTTRGQDRNCEAELPNRIAHPIDGMVVLPRVVRIGSEFLCSAVNELEVGSE